MRPKIIVIVGPTASGKSSLAVDIAKKFNGEVVSADSRQFYKGMDIGTAKITEKEMDGVPHHLINFLTPDQPTNVYEFQKKAFEIIDDILKRKKLPILVGGTGLFVSAVIENYSLSNAPIDAELRQKLNELSDDELIKRLLELNPKTQVDLKNRRRVERQLESILLDPNYIPGTKEPIYQTLILQPEIERTELNKRINKRVEEMFKNGLPTEVAGLAIKYGWSAHGLSAIGYREFQGADKLDEIKEQVKINTRNYAKRQGTWFRRYKDIKFVKDSVEAEGLVSAFLEA